MNKKELIVDVSNLIRAHISVLETLQKYATALNARDAAVKAAKSSIILGMIACGLDNLNEDALLLLRHKMIECAKLIGKAANDIDAIDAFELFMM
jgi:hypothetical protein